MPATSGNLSHCLLVLHAQKQVSPTRGARILPKGQTETGPDVDFDFAFCDLKPSHQVCKSSDLLPVRKDGL